MSRIVLIGVSGESTDFLYSRLSQVAPTTLVLEEKISRWTLARRRAKRLGWVAVLGQTLFLLGLVPLLRRLSARRIRELCENPVLDSSPPGSVYYVSSVNDASCIDFLREVNPEVVVLSGTRIVHPRVISSVTARFINMHAGITPAYRGVHGAYWARVENLPHLAGTTIHVVDEGIDTGGILAQVLIDAKPEDNYVTLPYLQLIVGLPVLVEVVSKELSGQPVSPWSRTDLPSKLRYHPTLWDYLWKKFTRGIG